MRCGVLAMVLGLLVVGTVADAATVLTGTVVGLNPAAHRLVVMPTGGRSAVTVQLPAGALPSFVRSGQTVRIPGQYTPGNRQRFQGRTVIPVPASPPRSDPTGVRSRLNRLQ